jgi:glyoxylate carboligase
VSSVCLGVSGFDLTQAIKAIDDSLPVIAFSGVATRAALERSTIRVGYCR